MNNTGASVWAIVPAAGLGRRFREGDVGAVKQLADVGGRTLLAAVLDALDGSRVAGVVVVVSDAVRAAIERERPAGGRRVYVTNPRPDGEMIESIQIGLAAAMQQRADAGREGETGFMICPGDHPCLSPAAVDMCLQAFLDTPDLLVIATHQGRRGHPLILPEALAAQVARWPASRRLNELRTLYPDRVKLVETPEPGVLVDVDTVADFEEARDLIRNRKV